MKKNPISPKRTELQRLLSKRGLASRKRASALIIQGQVKVNGKVVRDPSAYISLNSKVSIDGTESSFQGNDPKILIAFNKPKGIVTSASDERGRRTVYDLLPEKYRHLKAIGRLDMATTGLLLFTNDAVFANGLLDPKNNVPRTYVVTVKGRAVPIIVESLKSGVSEGGQTLKAHEVVIRKCSGKESILIVTLCEGKNREIRRMCEVIGHPVIKLKRIRFGEIELGDLKSGEVKIIPLF